MLRLRKLLPAAGTALVVGLVTTACSSSGDDPADAATAPPVPQAGEFCPAWEEALTALATLGATEPSEEDWEEVRSGLEALAEVGAPAELSDGAVEGLTVFTDSLLALDHRDVARLQDRDNLPGVTDEQEAQSRAFTEEASQLCGQLG